VSAEFQEPAGLLSAFVSAKVFAADASEPEKVSAAECRRHRRRDPALPMEPPKDSAAVSAKASA
jgi:hypothetical protein